METQNMMVAADNLYWLCQEIRCDLLIFYSDELRLFFVKKMLL
jgi:hypothetical protein